MHSCTISESSLRWRNTFNISLYLWMWFYSCCKSKKCFWKLHLAFWKSIFEQLWCLYDSISSQNEPSSFYPTSSLPLCLPITLFRSWVVTHTPRGEPQQSDFSSTGMELPRGRKGSTEARVVRLKNGSPSHCLGFPAGLFWYIVAYHTKAWKPRHKLINDNSWDNG